MTRLLSCLHPLQFPAQVEPVDVPPHVRPHLLIVNEVYLTQFEVYREKIVGRTASRTRIGICTSYGCNLWAVHFQVSALAQST